MNRLLSFKIPSDLGDYSEYQALYKKFVVKTLAVIGLPLCAFFSVYNLVIAWHVGSAAAFLLFLALAIILYGIRKSSAVSKPLLHPDLVFRVFLAVFILYLLYAVGMAHKTSRLPWFLVLPVIIFFLTSGVEAVAWTLSIAAAMLYFIYFQDRSPFPEESALLRTRLIIIFTVLSCVAWLVSSMVRSAIRRLFDKQQEIQSANRKLQQEIEDRRRVEAALRGSESFLNSLLNATPIPVFYKGEDGRYLGANQSFETFLGAPKEALIGRTVFDINPPEIARIHTAKDLEVLENGKVLQYESQLRNAQKEMRDVVMHKAIFHDARGRRTLIGAILDVTDQKRFEYQLVQAQKREAIGTLAGGIAHDFNNILAPIIGLADLLREDLAPGSTEREYAARILQAGERGRDLVQQILALSRQSERCMIPVRLQQILMETLKLAKATIPANICILHDIQRDCCLVMADPSQIHQVAMNLITNAYHAVEKTGGTISISLRETGGEAGSEPSCPSKPGRRVLLAVSDTGCGIAPEVLDRIFEPYFTTKAQGKGTGLGLAVVDGIVKNHHGNIQVSSQVEQGTTVSIYLPLMEAPARDEPDAGMVEDARGTERILLVDDEEPIVRFESEILARLGYQVTARVGSVEALAAFKAQPDKFDLVITDMSMPNLTGDQLAAEIRPIRPDLPIIICTGFSQRMDEERSHQMGIQAFLMKPVVRADMARTIRRVLDAAKAASPDAIRPGPSKSG